MKVIFTFLALSSNSTIANIFDGCLTHELLIIALSLDGSTPDAYPNNLNDFAVLYWAPSVCKALWVAYEPVGQVLL